MTATIRGKTGFVTGGDSGKTAVRAAIADTGRLDFAVNNAGYDGEG